MERRRARLPAAAWLTRCQSTRRKDLGIAQKLQFLVSQVTNARGETGAEPVPIEGRGKSQRQERYITQRTI
jgi:hypothetical protein